MTVPIHPATIAAIMSYGLQTVDAAAPLTSVIGRLRRIGHEGFPVVSGGQIVGLLTRRDADRAAEHGLPDLRVRDIMLAGRVTVTRDDAVDTALRRMVETGWWQIPVIDAAGQPIGIVTRTDVLKWWAGHSAAGPTVTLAAFDRVLGAAVTRVIRAVIAAAAAQGITVYLVGGIVRDLLLERPSDDVDFVVEPRVGDDAPFGTAAAQLAQDLAEHFGGTVQTFRPFGTAKWIPAPATAAALGLTEAALPDHIDFASARAEFYEQPTALPTVYTSSIKLDLARRDFTINALALRFSSTAADSADAAIIDYFGGLADLRAGRLRVLHPLSFVDDPTRMLRAARFESRAGFALDPRTADLLTLAVPLLGRVTGERVRTEISLLLHEADPVRGLRLLAARGCLTALHPAFMLATAAETHFTALMALDLPPTDREIVGWHLLAAALPADQVMAWTTRLLLPGRLTEAINRLHDVLAKHARLSDPALPVSIRARWLDTLPALTLTAAAILLAAEPAAAFIAAYRARLRDQRPIITGVDLKQRGLPPGPCYGRILDRLLDAHRDDLIQDRAGENHLIDRWLSEGICAGG